MTPTTTAETTVVLGKIAAHPRNPRRDVGDVTELAASIKSMGILQPLVVAPWPTDSDAKKPRGADYILLAGHRRLTAAKQAALKEVPVTVRADIDTTAKQLEAMLVENLHRADLTPVEEADTYQALLDLEGLTQAALAAAVGQPKSRVSERLKLARLEPAVKEKVHAGQLTITDALAIGTFADDAETTKTLIKAVGTDRFDWALRSAEQERRRAAELEKRLTPFIAAGFNIERSDSYEPPKGWKPLSQLIEKVPERYREPEAKVDAAVLKYHSECPGRALRIRNTDIVEHYCVEPKLHPKPKVTKSKAELAAEAEAKARLDDYRANVAVATSLRREHVTKVLFAAGADQEQRAHQILAESVLPTGLWLSEKDKTRHRRFIASFLDVDFPGDADAAAQEAELIKAMKNLTLPGMVLLTVVADTHLSAEENLAKVPSDGQFWGGSRDWIHDLTDVFGYEWSEWERKTFKVDTVLADTEDGDDE